MNPSCESIADHVPLRFHHVGISVPSIDDAILWYSKTLGFHLDRRFSISKANAQAAILVNGTLRIELFEVTGAAPLPPDRREPNLDIMTHGNKHLAFAIDDLDDFLAMMIGRNADIALIVRESFGSGCFIRDCAGNLIEFVEIKSWSQSADLTGAA